jgi:hypothetical protein
LSSTQSHIHLQPEDAKCHRSTECKVQNITIYGDLWFYLLFCLDMNLGL